MDTPGRDCQAEPLQLEPSKDGRCRSRATGCSQREGVEVGLGGRGAGAGEAEGQNKI